MVNRISEQHQGELLKGGGIGGLIGMFLGRPLLGVLGGLAYKLFTTEGLADSAKKVVGDFMNSDDPLGSLGSFLGGGQRTSEAPHKVPFFANDGKTNVRIENQEDWDAYQRSKNGERPAERKSGLPTWAKWGIGIVAGTAALNFVQDNFVNTFLGIPRFGGGFPFFNNGWNPNVPIINPGFNWMI